MDNNTVIELIRKGDQETIKSVYSENAKDIYSFAKSITGEHTSAMEATKQTFIKLFTDIQQGGSPSNLRMAALKIAYDESCAMCIGSEEDMSDIDEELGQTRVISKGRLSEEVPEYTDECTGDEPSKEEILEATTRIAAIDGADIIQAAADSVESETSEKAENAADVLNEQSNDIIRSVEETAHIHTDEAETDLQDHDDQIRSGVRDFAEDTEEDIDIKIPDTVSGSDDTEEIIPDIKEPEHDISNTQVFNLSMDYKDGELVIDEEEEIPEDEDIEDDEDEHAERQRSKGGTVVLVIINIILVLILLWLLYGLLVNFGVVPKVADLGYSWFNAHVYPLF